MIFCAVDGTTTLTNIRCELSRTSNDRWSLGAIFSDFSEILQLRWCGVTLQERRLASTCRRLAQFSGRGINQTSCKRNAAHAGHDKTRQDWAGPCTCTCIVPQDQGTCRAFARRHRVPTYTYVPRAMVTKVDKVDYHANAHACPFAPPRCKRSGDREFVHIRHRHVHYVRERKKRGLSDADL